MSPIRGRRRLARLHISRRGRAAYRHTENRAGSLLLRTFCAFVFCLQRKAPSTRALTEGWNERLHSLLLLCNAFGLCRGWRSQYANERIAEKEPNNDWSNHLDIDSSTTSICTLPSGDGKNL